MLSYYVIRRNHIGPRIYHDEYMTEFNNALNGKHKWDSDIRKAKVFADIDWEAIKKVTPPTVVAMLIKKENNMQEAHVSGSSPLTDEEIEREGEKRYGEVIGGGYHAARPMDKARFIKGAKWARDFKRQ